MLQDVPQAKRQLLINRIVIFQLSISTTDATMHGANDGSADLSISNAFGATLYDWSNGSTTEDQTALSAAVYTVTVTGCRWMYKTN
jgi:hypothetical protein